MASPDILHLGIIRNGKKIYYRPELYLRQIQLLEGKEFEERIKEKFVKPSTSTHAFYRGAIIPTCLLTEKFGGWSEDEIHTFFTNMYLSRTIEKVFESSGEVVELKEIDSTGSLNQKEMNIFIERVLAFLADEGIEVLSPEQYSLSKYRIVKK